VTGGFTVAVWVGNFSGRPMRQVSGVTGAGPLLHRALVDVARRYEPGVLTSPAAAGAVRVAVCRLSGLRAGAECPGTDEWFLPGTEPVGDCDWHGANGRVTWPAAYAPWAQQNGRGDVAGLVAAVLAPATAAEDARTAPPGAAMPPTHAAPDSGFRIVSPLDGDRYQVPPGVDARYATIALRVAGAPDDAPVRWWVDGRPTRAARWQLRTGAHAFRAVARSGRVAEAQISVR
jgi:penicillin-binding protein 1C